MENAELISNLDYLRAENRLAEYVDQFYFFFEQAVQQQDLATVNKLLTDYLRELFYTDNRVRLHALMERVEHVIMEREHKQYQPMFYLVKGNLQYFSINFEQANVEYKKAVSLATEMKNFSVLATALNNILASKDDVSSELMLHLTTMPPILAGMAQHHNKRKQYMLLIVHVESAMALGKYTYSQKIIDLLRANLAHRALISRELLQVEMLQLRIYVEIGQYEQFFQALSSFGDDWSFQYDLQLVAYEQAIQAAKGLQNNEQVQYYEQRYVEVKEFVSAENAQMHRAPGELAREQLLTYMVPFATLKKKAERHIARKQLPSYCVVMFHLEQEALNEEELNDIQASIHAIMLPRKQAQLFSCTMVSEQKMLYVLKTTEEEMVAFLQQYMKPCIQQYRQTLQKQFRVIISYVQNDLYHYETFEQTLQYAYALLYYARHNGEGALLNA